MLHAAMKKTRVMRYQLWEPQETDVWERPLSECDISVESSMIYLLFFMCFILFIILYFGDQYLKMSLRSKSAYYPIKAQRP